MALLCIRKMARHGICYVLFMHQSVRSHPKQYFKQQLKRELLSRSQSKFYVTSVRALIHSKLESLMKTGMCGKLFWMHTILRWSAEGNSASAKTLPFTVGHTTAERSTDVSARNAVTIFWVNKSGVLGDLIYIRHSDDYIGYSHTHCLMSFLSTRWMRNAQPNLQKANLHHDTRKKNMNIDLLEYGSQVTASWQFKKIFNVSIFSFNVGH